MRKAAMLTLAVSLAAVSSVLANGYGDWPVRHQDSVVKKFSLAGGAMRVDVDNVNGYVHVIADGGSEVEMRAHKTIRAETDADLTQAEKEVSLDVQQQNGTVSILYDAPWRCREHSSNCGDHHRRFYEVIYDIDLRVPRGSRLALSTVNNGDVEVKNSAGMFEVRNVNGAINMEGISGSGEVKTVNGPISVRFTKEPSEACTMKTVNGSVDAYFPHHLSADLLFKTFNGQVYTDFDVSPRNSAEQQPVRDGGKFIYRRNRFIAGRVGTGGREYSFETLNGDIRLHEQD
jgi:putative adhesin